MASAANRLRVLFLCTGNSCRSQMAEGWAKEFCADSIEAYSAGTEPHGLNPLAVLAMAEVNVDITKQYSKPVESLANVTFDYVVTVCDKAQETCPVWNSNAKAVHAGFDDPPFLARDAKSQEEAMVHYRRVRDEIKNYIKALPGTLTAGTGRTSINQHQGNTSRSENNSMLHSVYSDTILNYVREGYSKIAESGCCGPSGGGCCGATAFTPEELATAVGYARAELASVPEGANMGLSCGNPGAIASLQSGEIVLDLGAGGGFDCFIAGPKVGSKGRVIGVDMTPQMLTKARRNITSYRELTGLDNVEFRLGKIESLPVQDSSVNVVISNCVLNLSPDKQRVWLEVARVLKPGGRVAISDLALLKPLPGRVKADIDALIGCVAGAVLIEEMQSMAVAAGLTRVKITAHQSYIAAMENWEDPLYQRIVQELPPGSRLSDYITSVEVSAVKP